MGFQLGHLERKQLSTFVKVLDDAEVGTVEMYVSGIGNVDEVKDVIEPGAYQNTLRARNPKGIWAHDWALPIMRTLESEEVSPGDPRLPEKIKAAGIGALRIKALFNLNTQRGREAHEDVKFYGPEQEWSIGYVVKKSNVDQQTGIRHITELDLYEYSPVLFGANPLTGTAAVKDAKVVPGSFEERQEIFHEALKLANDAPTLVVATFDDSVVYLTLEPDENDMYREATYRRGYTDNGDGTYTFGEPEPVAIVETIQAKDIERLREGVDEKAGKTETKPWHVEKRGEEFCVIKDSDGATVKCHPTREEADAHVRALYANEKTVGKVSGGEVNNSGSITINNVPYVPADTKQADDAEAALHAIDLAVELLRTKVGRIVAKRNEDRLTGARDNIAAVLEELNKGTAADDNADKGMIDNAALMEFQMLALDSGGANRD